MREDPTLFRFPESSARTSLLDLPADLLARSRRRVQVVALLALIGFGLDVVIFLVGEILRHLHRIPPVGAQGSDVALVAFVSDLVAVCLATTLILLARHSRWSHQIILALALVFEIVLCGIVSVFTPWWSYLDSQTIPPLTWATPLILLFPLIVPVRPATTTLVALTAASTAPLGLMFLHATGRVVATTDDFVVTVFSPLVAVLFATVSSRVVYGMGMEIVRARQVGSYQLVEKLGSGGMGEVWRAQHRMLARPAAVKLIHRELLHSPDGEGILARFEREAQATAGMRSPHTIQLYDYGSTTEGEFYTVMEFLDGMDLEALVRRFGPLPVPRVIHLLRQCCDSLAEAHEQGLIHRDVKPANIYVCHYGRYFDFIKVLDFGLVKSVQPVLGEGVDLTAPALAAGTPATMSPEQILGKGLDGRADLYGLGCVAYWLLTGTRVFEGDNPMQVLTQHVLGKPDPPSLRCETPIPEDLDAVVIACLAKDPHERPPSAEDLDRLLAAVEAQGTWTPAHARAWWHTHGIGVAPAPTG